VGVDEDWLFHGPRSLAVEIYLMLGPFLTCLYFRIVLLHVVVMLHAHSFISHASILGQYYCMW